MGTIKSVVLIKSAVLGLFAGQSAAEDTCVPVQWGVPLSGGWDRLVFFVQFSFSSGREGREAHPAVTDKAQPRLLTIINRVNGHIV